MRFLIGILLSGIFFCSVSHANESDDYLAEGSKKVDDLYSEWKKAGGLENKELSASLLDAAVKAYRPEIVDEIAAGGNFAVKEIPLSDAETTVNVHLVFNLANAVPGKYSESYTWVIRRMTKSHFEVWQPTHGWLFDSNGNLLNEAVPPRRDGCGREWYGAFLPDGRWVTTDIWEMDRTLHFFSRKGRWMRDLTSRQLAPRASDPGSYSGEDLIGWCRSDRYGSGFVVSIGADGGRATVYVKPDGKTKILTQITDPWKLCYPRDLESKGMFTSLIRPSDDLHSLIQFSAPAHGDWCSSPFYHWIEDDGRGICISEGDANFGFMPEARGVFIGASDYRNEDSDQKRKLKTWFFSEKGFCQGWLQGSYLTDAENGKNTWYLDEKNGVTILNEKLKPISRLRFVLEEATISPEKQFPDLKLGFFRKGSELVLVRWD